MVTWGQIIPPDQAIVGPNERVIEIPLALEVMQLDKPGWVLDAGCALNGSMPDNPTANIVHLTQNIESEKVHATRHRSYLSADLRTLDDLFADDTFDRVVCVSTLEHVGLDNAGYGAETESCPETMHAAVNALAYLTGWTVLLTVPWSDAGQTYAKWRYVSEAETRFMAKTIKDWGFTVDVRYYARNTIGWYGGDTVPVDAHPNLSHDAVNAIVAIKGTR